MAMLAADITVDPFDVSRPDLYRDDVWQAPLACARAAAPVRFVPDSGFGAYWSVASYQPIVEVESLPDLYSSADGIVLADFIEGSDDVRMPMSSRWTGPSTPASAARAGALLMAASPHTSIA